MWKRALAWIASSVPAQAWAGSCVVLDVERDNLTADERAAAVVLFEDELRAAGRDVGPAPCDEAWTLSHTRLGDAITARANAMGRDDKLAVGGVEELSSAYERLVRALISGQPAAQTADRDSVLEAQSDPRRVQVDTMAMVRVGAALLPNTSAGGPAFGAGTRFELDRFGVDIAFDLAVPTSSGPFFIAGQGRLTGLVFADPEASATPYAGLGFGAGGSGTEEGGFFGPVATASIGMCFLRETTARAFPQLDFAAPLGAEPASGWQPWVTLSFGVAYQPPMWGRRR